MLYEVITEHPQGGRGSDAAVHEDGGGPLHRRDGAGPPRLHRHGGGDGEAVGKHRNNFV